MQTSEWNLFLSGVILLAVGCSSSTPHADVAALYNRSAQTHEALRNPVVVIPGILGSQLREKQSGQVVWGAFDADSADPTTPEGARLIALPIEAGASLNETISPVGASGVLDRVKLSLLGLPVELQAYAAILRTLGAGGYRDESLARSGSIDYGDGHFTCFQFPYDWRRDISFNASVLDGFLREKRAYIERELHSRYGITRSVKFDIVAHSMGGLVARYYLQYGAQPLPDDGSLPVLTWGGTELIDRVVLVGTPNAGSVRAFEQLLSGADYGPFIPSYDKALLGSMPSIYELLPRGRHEAYLDVATATPLGEDILDPAVWERYGWGLADKGNDETLQLLLPEVDSPDERHKIALAYLRRALARARQFQEAMDQPITLPSGLSLSLFVGDAIPTASAASVDRSTGEVTYGTPVPGDGTVPRRSVLLDERTASEWSPALDTPIPWSQVTFLFSDHIGLTMDPAFTDNILFRLLEQRPNTQPRSMNNKEERLEGNTPR